MLDNHFANEAVFNWCGSLSDSHKVIKIITCWQTWACVSYVQVKEERTTNVHQGIYPLDDKHDQNGAQSLKKEKIQCSIHFLL